MNIVKDASAKSNNKLERIYTSKLAMYTSFLLGILSLLAALFFTYFFIAFVYDKYKGPDCIPLIIAAMTFLFYIFSVTLLNITSKYRKKFIELHSNGLHINQYGFIEWEFIREITLSTSENKSVPIYKFANLIQIIYIDKNDKSKKIANVEISKSNTRRIIDTINNNCSNIV